MKRRNALITNKTRAGRKRRARQAIYGASDLGKYTKARNNARARGVEWLFDFEGWLKVWKDSGHWKERGRAAGRYQMARKGDCGPYADWNVAIVRMESNATAVLVSHGMTVRPLVGALRSEVAEIL